MTNVAVNIRGTSGSGKSTVARRLIEALEGVGHANVQVTAQLGGRERVAGHQVGPVFFMGKYATDCGGVDSMSWKGAADDICDLVHHKLQFGHVVLEGLMVSSWGTGRLLDLWERCDRRLHVLMLSTPLEECLRSVNERRARRAEALGKEYSPVNPENTTAKYHGSLKGAQNLLARGMQTIKMVDREEAYTTARGLLEI